MNPQESLGPAAPTAVKNPLATMRPGEQVICEIKRHPIGIIGMYGAVGLLLVIVAVTAFVIAPDMLTSYSAGQVRLTGALIFLIAAILGIGFLFVVHTIYWGNSWIVTSDSITQVRRISLFDKQTSQLSLGNLEDITAEQNGMLAQMLHFGVISAETAAATDKFTFIYCPDPNYYAQQILAARERFEQQHRPPAETPAPPAAREATVSYTVPTTDTDTITSQNQGGISPD